MTSPMAFAGGAGQDGEHRPPHSWTAVVVLTATNLVPLALVLQGSLDLGLLLLCYALESAVLVVFGPARSATPGLRGVEAEIPMRLRVAAPVLILAFGAMALTAVTWSWTAVLVVLVTVALALGGLSRAGRQDRDVIAWTPLTLGWRLLVLTVGGLVALPYLEHIAELRTAGWTGTTPSDGLPAAAAAPLNSFLMSSSASPEVLGATIFVLFVTVNEGLFAARRVLRSTDGSPG